MISIIIMITLYGPCENLDSGPSGGEINETVFTLSTMNYNRITILLNKCMDNSFQILFSSYAFICHPKLKQC